MVTVQQPFVSFVIVFASVQTSRLNEANRIDLPAFFCIPCSLEPSKECMLFHAVLMNGTAPACSSVPCVFSPGVFLQAENASLSRAYLPQALADTQGPTFHPSSQPSVSTTKSLTILSLKIILLFFIVAYRQRSLAFEDITHSYVKSRVYPL